jgi:TRAP-type C4-dicarboxylate transport system permease small subunit
VSAQWRNALEALERNARRFENGLLVVLLSVLVALASSQILLRNVFSTSLAWGDEAVRLLVLWLALVGAVAASRDARQIRIDVLARLLPRRWLWVPELVAAAFTACVCGALAWHSTRFVLDSRAFGDTLLGEQPAWLAQIILPVGFAIIGYRYLVRALRALVEKR